jgi:mRNA interferase HigB
VFNIKGNAYRLVAVIRFKIRTVFIKFIGTHAEYDKIDVTTVNDF